MPVKTKIGKGGRFVIPAEYRDELGIHEGDNVVVRIEDGELRVKTLRKAVEDLQAFVREYVPKDRDLVEELLQERREENARESGE